MQRPRLSSSSSSPTSSGGRIYYGGATEASPSRPGRVSTQQKIRELESVVLDLQRDNAHLLQLLHESQTDVQRERATKEAAIQKFHDLAHVCDQMRAQHHQLLLDDEDLVRRLTELSRLETMTDDLDTMALDLSAPSPSSSLAQGAGELGGRDEEPLASLKEPRTPLTPIRDKDRNKENIPPWGMYAGAGPGAPTPVSSPNPHSPASSPPSWSRGRPTHAPSRHHPGQVRFGGPQF